MLLRDTHIAEDALDDVHVKRDGALADGHEVEHALGVEVCLADLEGLDLYLGDVLIGFLCRVSAITVGEQQYLGWVLEPE